MIVATGINLYAYVENAPVSYIDPLGFQKIEPPAPDQHKGILGKLTDKITQGGAKKLKEWCPELSDEEIQQVLTAVKNGLAGIAGDNKGLMFKYTLAWPGYQTKRNHYNNLRKKGIPCDKPAPPWPTSPKDLDPKMRKYLRDWGEKNLPSPLNKRCQDCLDRINNTQ